MHAQREMLHNELHSRPSIYLEAPAHVFHLAYLANEQTADILVRTLDLTTKTRIKDGIRQGITHLDGAPLKWERHNEFFTLTLAIPSDLGPKQQTWKALPTPLETLVRPFSSNLINSVQIAVSDSTNEAEESKVAQNLGFRDPAASCIGGGDAAVWSDFTLDGKGMSRFLFMNRRLNSYRLGRMIRRILEIETYRMMATLTLPVAQALSSKLNIDEQQLVKLSELNATSQGSNARLLLSEIALLSARLVSQAAKSRQRFEATKAYSELVFERLSELRETHMQGSQRIGVFIERRFKPSVRYCLATWLRLEQLSKSVAHLSDLLQARVQVEIEEQNAEILGSLNSRADTQIKIQRAVEGLSLIGITYYLLSLVSMIYSALHVLGMELTAKQSLIAASPIVLFAIYSINRRINRAKGH